MRYSTLSAIGVACVALSIGAGSIRIRTVFAECEGAGFFRWTAVSPEW